MSVRLVACKVTQQIQAGSIRPLQVVEYENHRMWCANDSQESSYGFVQPKACLLMRQWRRCRKVAETSDQLRQKRGQYLRCCGNLRAQLVQRGHLDVSTKGLQERQIRWHTLSLGCTAMQDYRSIFRSKCANLIEETGFANPCFS